MDKTTKILIILIFVCSLGFLIFAAKTIDRIETQKKLISSLLDSVSSLQNTINSLETTINSAKNEIVSLRSEVNRLGDELATAIKEREKAIQDLAVVQDENKKLSTELNDAKEKVASLTKRTSELERKEITLNQLIDELEANLKNTGNKLATAEDKLAKLESVGILVEKEAIQPGEGKTPQIDKVIEGKIVDTKPNGVVAINFKGSIKPQKGSTFYVVNSGQVKARLSLEEIYNTIMVAHMDVKRENSQTIKDGDEVRLILWTEKTGE